MATWRQPRGGSSHTTLPQRKGRRARRLLAAIPIAVPVAAALVWLMIPPYRGKIHEYSAATKILDRHGHLLRVVLDRNGLLSDPIRLEQSGDWTAQALIAAEDKRFYRHGGVDPLAACRAAWSNVRAARIVSGASTISMLVGKLTEPRPRTVWTKIVEAEHARHLEGRLSKEQLLEQYLNRAPFGGNLVGVEAAAWRYFGKPAAELTLSEAALLIGLPQSPTRLRPDLFAERAEKRKRYVLERMALCGFITSNQLEQASAQAASIARQPSPFLAPHFCDFVSGTRPRRPSLVTSLDLDVQSLAERMLRARLDNLRDDGIRGGSVVILDVSTGRVRALVGSPDYANPADDGQVNGALSRRSPGSALKPFVYAMALDAGLCSPSTVVIDAPVNFAGYRPENFDREYRGPVSVREALLQSLNIPALLYVQKLGLKPVVRCLRDAGFSTLDQRADHYGLSIAMGTCEVTLLDLANAYACLARKGVYREVSCLEQEASQKETRLFSEEAAYLIADILSGEERAFTAEGHVAEVRQPRVAWKTGTSAGNRDAWCIAYNPDYVVGVWLGNPSGRASAALIGSSAAAPVAHRLFRGLYPNGAAPWFDRPPGIRARQVCAATGQIPQAGCPATLAEDYIPGAANWAPCTVHGAVAGAAGAPAGRNQSAPHPGTGNNREPPSPAPKQTAEGRSTGMTPAGARKPVRIVSPGRQEVFRLVEDTPALRQEVTLRADSNRPSSDLYWFVDKEFYARAGSATDVSWPLRRGKHVIGCCDGKGQGDSVVITVE